MNASSRSKISTVMSSTLPGKETPALLNRISSRPCAAITASTTWAQFYSDEIRATENCPVVLGQIPPSQECLISAASSQFPSRRPNAPPRSSRGIRRRWQAGHEFHQIRLPNCCVIMAEMSVRALAIGRQHVGAVRNLFEGAFDRAERRRISKSSSLLISMTCASIFGRSASGL